MQAEPELVIAYTDGVLWQWLRSHSVVPLNEHVDRLARERLERERGASK